MSASTEESADGLVNSAVRPAGLIWFAICVAALAAGFWPHAIFMSKSGNPYTVLPVLQMLAVGQVLWSVGIYPIVIQRRLASGNAARWRRKCLVENVWMTLAASPVYLTAAWASDAVFGDVLRVILYSMCLWPVSLALGRLLASQKFRGPAMFAMLAILAGLPAAEYILEEFYRGRGGEIVWSLSPAIFAWCNAASRDVPAIPRPFWAAAVWFIAGTAVLLIDAIFSRRLQKESSSPR